MQVEALTNEAVAETPKPGMPPPSSVTFSPDRKLLTFLLPSPEEDNLLTRHLYSTDTDCDKTVNLVKIFDPIECESLGNTEDSLSLADKLRRERTRQDIIGVTQYAWGSKGNSIKLLLLPLNGDIWIKEFSDNQTTLRKIFDHSSSSQGDGVAIDPTLSPDGTKVAFVRDCEIYTVPTNGETPATRITFDARGFQCKTNGLADYIAQEEMERLHGFWWSPDSQYIAFEQVDDSNIPPYRIIHQGTSNTGLEIEEEHRYPFSGKENPKVKLGVLKIGAPSPVLWLDLTLDNSSDVYLARVNWLPDNSLAVQIQNRAQTVLELVRFDVKTGQRVTLLREKSSTWINLHNLFISFVKPQDKKPSEMDVDHPVSVSDFYFVWGSENSGFMHLYLYQFVSGRVILVGPLTHGEWMVTSLVFVDVGKGIVYFHANKSSPVEQHLYAVNLWSSQMPGEHVIQLTKEPGFHNVTMDGNCSTMVDIYSSLDQPPVGYMAKIDKGPVIGNKVIIYDINSNSTMQERMNSLRHVLCSPELFSFRSSLHEHTLYGLIYLPDAKLHGPGPYPLVVSVYGGPHVQNVLNQWDRGTNDMRAQRLANHGYVVLKVDNRGSCGRGIQFEGGIKHLLSVAEIQDQVEGVKHLIDRGLVDSERVGIYGWSYGGYMSLMCLATRPEIFHVAVAGAPVTSWDGYDTHYTERYMGTPQENPTGYENSSVMNHVASIEGKLLLVHGLVDENVHFRHTARLINQLIAHRIPHDLLIFPDERHAPRKLQDRVYLEQRLLDYFETNLKPRTAKKSKR